jgi:4-amino-4-deoxy-L-arabinose transferase-like glycosyltransferase
MILPYLGTLKTALYWPLLHVVRPGPFTARLPMVFAGALTVLLFYGWSKRAAGAVAALIGTLLFATHPSFILTNTLD